MHRKVAAALVAALALVAASCGESKETVTRAQLVSRVEQACRDGQRQADRQMRASRRSDGPKAFVDALLAGQTATMDAIDDLKAPEADEADFEALKEAMQARVDGIKRVSEADRAQYARVLREVQAEVDAAARRIAATTTSLGIEGCS